LPDFSNKCIRSERGSRLQLFQRPCHCSCEGILSRAMSGLLFFTCPDIFEASTNRPTTRKCSSITTVKDLSCQGAITKDLFTNDLQQAHRLHFRAALPHTFPTSRDPGGKVSFCIRFFCCAFVSQDTPYCVVRVLTDRDRSGCPRGVYRGCARHGQHSTQL
jgi:hypothetical protein